MMTMIVIMILMIVNDDDKRKDYDDPGDNNDWEVANIFWEKHEQHYSTLSLATMT